MDSKADRMHKLFYPEVGADGFTRVDGTINFYQRVNALVAPESIVLDYGAGRGRFLEDPVRYRRDLRLLRGRVAEVIGADVDQAVLQNPTLDRAVIIGENGRLLLENESVDLILSDFTFEHVTQPARVAAELSRVLKPGGWVCARTPNAYGVIGIPTRIVPNIYHNRILRIVQPSKRSVDTFPTAYKLNSFAAIKRYFPHDSFENFTYIFDSEPAYAGGSRVAWSAYQALNRLLPERFASMMFVLLRKSHHQDPSGNMS